MSKEQLFDSTSKPIPQVRRDLQVIPIQENGNSYLYFHDEKGYATPQFALNREAGKLLSLLDGRKSVRDLQSFIADEVQPEQLLQFIQMLDENRLLNSGYLKNYAETVEQRYEASDIHQPVTAGNSYPNDPQELRAFLTEAFSGVNNSEPAADPPPKALYAPHIDPRVGLDSYAKAFSSIARLKPRRVVILATSHYAGLYPDIYQESPFILVDKDFDMPHGHIPRDRKTIEELKNEGEKAGITHHDRAHRLEHSIELHLLFLRYLWDHEFEVVPILTRGLDDLYYMEEGYLGQQLSRFAGLLNNRFGKDDETFFLISGDLAHFGKKFGDETPASSLFEQVKQFDRDFMDRASGNHPRKLLKLMKRDMDPYRICGFPPLYTFLKSMPDLKGEVLSYDLWDEQERESAVSYGSILYR